MKKLQESEFTADVREPGRARAECSIENSAFADCDPDSEHLYETSSTETALAHGHFASNVDERSVERVLNSINATSLTDR